MTRYDLPAPFELIILSLLLTAALVYYTSDLVRILKRHRIRKELAEKVRENTTSNRLAEYYHLIALADKEDYEYWKATAEMFEKK